MIIYDSFGTTSWLLRERWSLEVYSFVDQNVQSEEMLYSPGDFILLILLMVRSGDDEWMFWHLLVTVRPQMLRLRSVTLLTLSLEGSGGDIKKSNGSNVIFTGSFSRRGIRVLVPWEIFFLNNAKCCNLHRRISQGVRGATAPPGAWENWVSGQIKCIFRAKRPFGLLEVHLDNLKTIRSGGPKAPFRPLHSGFEIALSVQIPSSSPGSPWRSQSTLCWYRIKRCRTWAKVT